MQRMWQANSSSTHSTRSQKAGGGTKLFLCADRPGHFPPISGSNTAHYRDTVWILLIKPLAHALSTTEGRPCDVFESRMKFSGSQTSNPTHELMDTWNEGKMNEWNPHLYKSVWSPVSSRPLTMKPTFLPEPLQHLRGVVDKGGEKKRKAGTEGGAAGEFPSVSQSYHPATEEKKNQMKTAWMWLNERQRQATRGRDQRRD